MAGKSTRRAAKPAADNLILTGTGQGQLRKPSKRNWTKAKQREFLTVLSETCNVTRAADEAGVSLTHAYRKRKNDAAFRAAWAEAIAAAYQRLELMLLDRALNGTEKIIRRKDGSEERMMDYSSPTALALLKMHRDMAVEGNPDAAPEDIEEIRQRLFDKLERLRKREERARSDAE